MWTLENLIRYKLITDSILKLMKFFTALVAFLAISSGVALSVAVDGKIEIPRLDHCQPTKNAPKKKLRGTDSTRAPARQVVPECTSAGQHLPDISPIVRAATTQALSRQ